MKTATLFFVIFWARGTINPAHRGPKATFLFFFRQLFSEVAPRQRRSRKYTFSDEKEDAVLGFLHFAKIHSLQRILRLLCFVLRRNKKPTTKNHQKKLFFNKRPLRISHSWGTPFSCSSTYCDFGVPKQTVLEPLWAVSFGAGEATVQIDKCTFFQNGTFFFRQHRSSFVKL